MSDNSTSSPNVDSNIGPYVTAAIFAITAILIFLSRRAIFSFGGNLPIHNGIMGTIFAIMAFSALIRKISFTYFFLMISLFVTFLELFFGRGLMAGTNVIILLLEIVLLVFIPLKAQDFDYAKKMDLLNKAVNHFGFH